MYAIEGLASVASSLLNVGIFFFTRERFGWGLPQNLLFSAGLGLFYTAGALSAHGLTQRFGRRAPLAICMGLAAAMALLAAIFTTPAVVAIATLTFTLFGTMCWPILENLVCAGDVRPEQMSRRVAVYNITWSVVAAVAVAASGTIIEHIRDGVFLIPTAACAIAAGIAWFGRVEPSNDGRSPEPHVAPPPEAKLLQQRVLALWLARISLPAMYVVTFALAAMMPSLAVLEPYRPAVQTVLSGVWNVIRTAAFLVLGATAFWHTKPRLLLAAGAAMLVSFVAITVRSGDVFNVPHAQTLDLSLMVGGQLLLGIATGLVYMASLYFGMVLTEGSAESGGYHEAMIGVGMVLGPSAGLVTQWLRPGDQTAAVAAVSLLLATSLAMASYASVHFRHRRQRHSR